MYSLSLYVTWKYSTKIFWLNKEPKERSITFIRLYSNHEVSLRGLKEKVEEFNLLLFLLLLLFVFLESYSADVGDNRK